MIPWNKGKTGIYSKETLEKMSKAKKGKPTGKKGIKNPKLSKVMLAHHVSEETKIKISQKAKERYKDKTNHPQYGKKGNKSPNWQGGKSSENMRVRQSLAFKEWRTSVFQRDNYTCMMCGHKGKLNAHHIMKFSEYQQLRYNTKNGITLCILCHSVTFFKETEFKNLFLLINQYGINENKLLKQNSFIL